MKSKTVRIGFYLALILVGLTAVYFQIQGAVQCGADGGEYVRLWTGWPACIEGN